MNKVLFFLLTFAITAFSAYADLTPSAKARAANLQTPRYEIEMELDPDNLEYKGTQTVHFLNRQKKAATYLLFFVYPNDPSITKANADLLRVSNVQAEAKSAKFEAEGPFLKIYLHQPLPPGKSVRVRFDFHAKIPAQTANRDLFTEAIDELKRLFNLGSDDQQDYGIFSSNKNILNLGLWHPILSKYDEKGWDEQKYSGIGDVSYFDPSDYNVSITVPSRFTVVTTGNTTKTVPMRDGRMQHTISSRLTRDFAVEVSANFEERVKLRNKTTIRSFSAKGHEESGLLALESAARALEYFEKIFGAYPYSELDVVEAPLYGGAGGVEFPGLVTISSMLYRNPAEQQGDDLLAQLMANNPAFDQLLEFVVAHEVAHQWWNAVIGSNSKQHPFVDEAMANYSAVLYFEHYYGREAAEKQMAMQMKLNYQLHRLLGGSDRPVYGPASSFNGPLEYSAIVYGKGALYFDRLRKLTGDPGFFAALREYYDTYWFRIASPQDFLTTVQKKNPEKKAEIGELARRWLEESHGDEDIGPGTLDELIRTALMGSPGVETPDVEQMFKQLDELLKQK